METSPPNHTQMTPRTSAKSKTSSRLRVPLRGSMRLRATDEPR